jgi:hypothetical protein
MTDFPDRPGYSFKPGPPPEASRFLKNKGWRPSFGFEDVEPEEHAVAFAVAKVMELDLNEAIRGEVQKALDEGLPFAAFKKSWRNNPALTEWWGKKEMVDPLTGATELVQLGSPRRLRTIYNANIRSARAAGQWERIERTKAAMPYLEYRLGPSEHHRPHHADKAGLILSVDNPIWDEWMPPNGWGCKCWVRQVTKREADRRGISVTPDIPDAIWNNKRTGERQLVPQGIDPGWQRNPGKLRLQAMEALLSDKIAALPAEVAKVALRDIASSWRVMRLATDPAAVGNAPIGLLPSAYAGEAGATKPVVEFSDRTRVHVFDEKEDRRIEDLAHLADLDLAARVVLQKRPGEQARLIFELDTAIDTANPDKYFHLPLRFYIVVKETGSFVSTFHRTTNRRWLTLIADPFSRILKGGD